MQKLLDFPEKVLVIGLDGASPVLLNRWMQEGLMPNLSGLVKQGVFGALRSVIPPNSIAAWASFATGVNPAKHGLHGFFRRETMAYEYHPISSNELMRPAIWDILGQIDKKSIVVNVPYTYPPQPINGAMVSGMLTPPAIGVATYPTNLAEELQKICTKRRFDVSIGPVRDGKKSLEDLLLGTIDMTETRRQIATYLLSNRLWDLGVVIFTSLDRFQHFFWNFLDPEGSTYNAQGAKKYSSLIECYLHELDNAIGELVELAGSNAAIFIMSDHGFGPLTGRINPQYLLKQLGFLGLRHKPLFRKDMLRKYLKYLDIFRLRRFLPRRQRPKSRYLRRLNSLYTEVNWQQTKAYWSPETELSMGFSINLQGREPQGIVSPSEYDQVCNSLTKALTGIRDPQTGRILIDEVLSRERVLSGPYLDQAPDLFAFTRKGLYETDIFGDGNSLVSVPDFKQGSHRLDGIFLAVGTGLQLENSFQIAQIIDLAPTILHLLGSTVPDDLDGRVLLELLQSDRPVKFSTHQDIINGNLDKIYTVAEEEELEERLRGLGYL